MDKSKPLTDISFASLKAGEITPEAAKEEITRRIALASEPWPDADPVPRPHIARFLGEVEALADPLLRQFRRLKVERAANPRTVMLMPGFATHPARLRYLEKQIARAGHTPKRWGTGFNLGATEERLEIVEDRLVELHSRTGEPLVLLGWSLGGLFARELAKRQPDKVAKVITMGSPFSGNPRSNNVWRAYQFIAGHSVDNPPIEADIGVKPPVETVAMWSPRDGMIAPRSAAGQPDERDRAIALRCTHIGFTYAPDSIRVVLAELDWDD